MKVGIFSTHPIQYQVPVWKALSETKGFEVKVFYFSDQGVSGSIDPGFGANVKWDTPLLTGYDYEFLSKSAIKDANKFCIHNARILLAKERFDVVVLHGYTHKFARQLVRLKRKFCFKLVLRGEFTDMPRRSTGLIDIVRNMYISWFYKYVDHFCPIGIDAIEHLKRLGIQDNCMTLSPYSVDNTYFELQRKKMDRVECREKLGISPGSMVFLFSGKLIQRKNPLLLAAAAQQLVEEYPQIILVYLGSGEQLDELTSRYSKVYKDRLILPGFVNQSELGKYFRASDVFVLPSNYDTWGLVVNEAMHFGLPCIVSDRVGSRRDLVNPDRTGLIFRHGDAKSLESCLRKFLEDPVYASRLGEYAYKHIQGYTIEKTADGLRMAIRLAVEGPVI